MEHNKIISTLNELLDELDSKTEPMAEYQLPGLFRQISKNIEFPNLPEELKAEILAFDFSENYKSQLPHWGEYYGPRWFKDNGDGTASESPSIKAVTETTINYWIKRAKQAKHPILRARYADLVWDFSKPVLGKTADYTIAIIVIDSIIEISQNDSHKSEKMVINKLERALSLAISLNDENRKNLVVKAIIEYENKIADSGELNLCGFTYDLLWRNKKNQLTQSQKDKIIADLELRLEHVSNPDKTQKPDHLLAEQFAVRLSNHYNSIGKNSEKERVLKNYVKAVERSCDSASAIQAYAWFQKVHSVLINFGMKKDAESIAVKLRNLGPKTRDELKPFSTTSDVKKEDLEKYVEYFISGSLEEIIIKIATQYIVRKEDAKNQLKKMAENNPLLSYMPFQAVDHKGRPVAFIGSIEDDLDGRIVHQLSQNMNFSIWWLRKVMESFVKKFNESEQELCDFIFQAPIFEDNKKQIIQAGLRAYLKSDYLTAIHLLVPQIEDSIRNLVELNKGSVLKLASRGGGLHLKNLDELLQEPAFIETFDEEISLYFRTLFTDPRGWNIRNDICHGISPIDQLGAGVADRVIQALLLISLVRNVDESTG